MSQQIEIRLEDVMQSSHYSSHENCPLATVCKRLFPERNITSVGISAIHSGLAYEIANIKPGFWRHDYERILQTGEPFVTTITFKDETFHPKTPDYYPELSTTKNFLQNSFEELEPNGY